MGISVFGNTTRRTLKYFSRFTNQSVSIVPKPSRSEHVNSWMVDGSTSTLISVHVKQPTLQQKFYFQCKSPASSTVFYGIGNTAVVNQSSSFTNGNLERKEGRSRSVCLQNFLHFCQNIYFICWMAASSTLTPSTRGQ